MKKVLLDTNVIIDLLAKREPYNHDVKHLFSLADQNKVRLYTSALSIANISYVLRKQLPAAESRRILRKLKMLVGILSLDEKVITLALNDNHFVDFEDSLQYYSATENRLEVIVTRNLKDFTHSRLPVMTARQVIEIL